VLLNESICQFYNTIVWLQKKNLAQNCDGFWARPPAYLDCHSPPSPLPKKRKVEIERDHNREIEREDKETPKKKGDTERKREIERERERHTQREGPKKKGGNIPVGTCMLLHRMDLIVGLLDTSSIIDLPLPT